MQSVTIKLFGPDRRLLGADTLSLLIEDFPITPPELLRKISEIHPKLAQSRLAVNCEFAPETALIGAGDELALIGNVCGG